MLTWIVKSPGCFEPPPLLLSTTFLTISVASLVFVNVQTTWSPYCRFERLIAVPLPDCFVLQLHALA